MHGKPGVKGEAFLAWKLNPLRRTAPGSQIRRWRLGVGLQHGCHHPLRREDGHGRQAPKDQVLA